MDVKSREISRVKSDAKNLELRLEIKVSQKGGTFYYEKGKNVHSGRRQHSVQMFDHLGSIDCSKRTT
jgi:hypothetical protein